MVHRRTRSAAIAATLGIATVELLRCASVLIIPEGPASTLAGVLVISGTPFFIGMAIRHWAIAIIGGLSGLYALVWACHLISGIPMFYDPPMGIVLMLIYPVGWLAVTLGWLGSRVPWVLSRALEKTNH